MTTIFARMKTERQPSSLVRRYSIDVVYSALTKSLAILALPLNRAQARTQSLQLRSTTHALSISLLACKQVADLLHKMWTAACVVLLLNFSQCYPPSPLFCQSQKPQKWNHTPLPFLFHGPPEASRSRARALLCEWHEHSGCPCCTTPHPRLPSYRWCVKQGDRERKQGEGSCKFLCRSARQNPFGVASMHSNIQTACCCTE